MLRYLLIVWLACLAVAGITSGAVMLWLEPNKLLAFTWARSARWRSQLRCFSLDAGG